jgi:hypothetical protein
VTSAVCGAVFIIRLVEKGMSSVLSSGFFFGFFRPASSPVYFAFSLPLSVSALPQPS